MHIYMTFWILCFLNFSIYSIQCFNLTPSVKNTYNEILDRASIYLMKYIATMEQYFLNKELIDLWMTMYVSNAFLCRGYQIQYFIFIEGEDAYVYLVCLNK